MGKFIIINHYGVTPDTPGATRHYEMSKYFSDKLEYEIEFWICGFNHHTGRNHPKLSSIKLQTSEKTDGFKTVRIRSTPYKKSKIARQINIIIFDLITAFKILFSTNIEGILLSTPPVTILSIVAAKLRKIKLIADVEDLWPLFLQEMGLRNKFVISYMEKSTDFLYRVADGVGAVSEGMVTYVRRRVNRKHNIWLSPLGVNLEEYSLKTVDEELIHDKVWKNDFKIMYLGAHGRANDIQAVLKTIKRFNYEIENYDKYAFVFIGDGEQKEELMAIKKKNNLSNVYFEDAVPGHKVPDYLMHADVCLTNLQKIQSFKLVRPNKLFQYMALRKPIISGIWGESRKIIEESQSGKYIDFSNDTNAVNELKFFLSNKQKLSIYGDNGRKYIEKFGDRKKIFSDMYDKINEIIRKK